jgi:hypothetical protein
MNAKPLFRCSLIIATALLVLGMFTRAQAQPAGNVTLLDDAYATLSQADHDYKGHRAAAMKQVQRAVAELGGRISGHGRVREPQATSDAQLRDAAALLQQAAAGLSGRALAHVNAAINQINTALAIH